MYAHVGRQWIMVIVGFVLLFPLASGAVDKKAGDGEPRAARRQNVSTVVDAAEQENEKKLGCKESLQSDGLSKSSRVPVYRPPLRGAPAGRVAGGTRGYDKKFPCLCVLAPDHVGLTVSKQPQLYYFLSAATKLPLEFTIIEKNSVYPLVESRLPPPHTAGIHVIRLADYGKYLRPKVQYQWFVVLIPDEEHRSNDILASGAIELVTSPNELKERLKKNSNLGAVYLYAEKGIWYDALANLSRMIEKNPADHGLRLQRASLLKQVGLSVASRDERQGGFKKQ